MTRRSRSGRGKGQAERLAGTRAGRRLTPEELDRAARDAASNEPARYRRMGSTAWGGAVVYFPLADMGVNTYSIAGEPGRRGLFLEVTCSSCHRVAAVIGRPNDEAAHGRSDPGLVAGTAKNLEWLMTDDGPGAAVWCPSCHTPAGPAAILITAADAQDRLDRLAAEVGPNRARRAVWEFPE